MPRDHCLERLSRDHHHGLVMALRIQRELPVADDAAVTALAGDLERYWSAALLPHFAAEDEGLLARLATRQDEGLGIAASLQREHRELEALIAVVRAAEGAAARRAALARFGAALGAHIRWEERELFEWVQQRFAPEEMSVVGAVVAARLPAVPFACPTLQSL